MAKSDTKKATGSRVNPVVLAVLRGRLEQIADEMDATLFRSAFNPIIAEAHDASHGLYDAKTGDTLVQGKSGLPIFVGVMAFAVKAADPEILEFQGTLEPSAKRFCGQTIVNDRHHVGQHFSKYSN